MSKNCCLQSVNDVMLQNVSTMSCYLSMNR